jgi:16S rRNA (uracil1498-N3)-methyltransferase
MQFTYHKNAKDEMLTIDGEEYRHIFKARRHKKQNNLILRNLEDDYIYDYEIVDIGKKSASLRLSYKELLDTKSEVKLHIGWCVIDPKNIEKTLPMLNEMGVQSITFINCKYSQNNFKIENMDKLDKILINSSQQCGRSDIIKLEACDSLEEFFEQNPKSVMINFSDDLLSSNNQANFDTIVVGCEGGFAQEEINLAEEKDIKILGLNSKNILKSQSVVVSVSAMKLL